MYWVKGKQGRERGIEGKKVNRRVVGGSLRKKKEDLDACYWFRLGDDQVVNNF